MIFPVLFSLYVNDIPPTSHHVELSLYADDTTIIAPSRKPTLLVRYLESYINDLQRWLSEWRIAINVSKSTGGYRCYNPSVFALLLVPTRT